MGQGRQSGSGVVRATRYGRRSAAAPRGAVGRSTIGPRVRPGAARSLPGWTSRASLASEPSDFAFLIVQTMTRVARRAGGAAAGLVDW